jgi:hypothetical protein
MQLAKSLDSPPNLLKKQQADHDQLQHQVSQFAHKAADLYNIPPTANSLACGQQQQKKKKTGTDISRIMFGIAASETWAHGGQREYVKQGWKPEMRGFCLAGEISEIRRRSSSWGANLLHHHGAAGSTIHHSKSHKTPPTSNTRIAGVSEMHSGFQGLWTKTFRFGLPNVDCFVMGG